MWLTETKMQTPGSLLSWAVAWPRPESGCSNSFSKACSLLSTMLPVFYSVWHSLHSPWESSFSTRVFFFTCKLEETGLNKESMGFCQVEGVFVLTSVGSATTFKKIASLKNVAPSWTSGERSIHKWNVLSFSPSSDCLVPQFSSKVQGRPGIFKVLRKTKMIGYT